MAESDQQFVDVLSSDLRFGEKLRRLYLLRQAGDRKKSLGWFCQIAGFPSKGYLSDIFSGRRVLPAKYAVGLADALHLSGLNRLQFITLAKMGEATPKKYLEFAQKLQDIDKARRVTLTGQQDDFTATDYIVFAGFGLCRGAVTALKLKRVLQDLTKSEIENSLERLARVGLITKVKLSYKIAAQQVLVAASSEDGARRFLETSLESAAKAVDPWYSQRAAALFYSTAVSVKASRYEAFLESFRELVLQHVSSIEADQGDAVVRFNVAIYPVAPTSWRGRASGTRLR